ncbi:MAG: DUF5348 domain-containing protein [Firmicutes bacterium]|nr:DUF5348 domain-containing protein [Bacillota bacterium]MCL5779578.1 DUF5348 domain-containing protein [Bacillota bacterium]
MGHREYGLHCGEYFEIWIGKTSIACRLELGNNWYIIMQGVRFNLRTQDTYRVKV